MSDPLPHGLSRSGGGTQTLQPVETGGSSIKALFPDSSGSSCIFNDGGRLLAGAGGGTQDFGHGVISLVNPTLGWESYLAPLNDLSNSQIYSIYRSTSINKLLVDSSDGIYCLSGSEWVPFPDALHNKFFDQYLRRKPFGDFTDISGTLYISTNKFEGTTQDLSGDLYKYNSGTGLFEQVIAPVSLIGSITDILKDGDDILVRGSYIFPGSSTGIYKQLYGDLSWNKYPSPTSQDISGGYGIIKWNGVVHVGRFGGVYRVNGAGTDWEPLPGNNDISAGFIYELYVDSANVLYAMQFFAPGSSQIYAYDPGAGSWTPLLISDVSGAIISGITEFNGDLVISTTYHFLSSNTPNAGVFKLTPYAVPCFFADAPVLTPSGYVPIAQLEEGDQVCTADGRTVSIIKKIVRHTKGGRETNPYIIPKGTFGALKKLYVSPNHKILTEAGMIKARDAGLEQEERHGPLTYYSLELEDYEKDNLVVAGVTAESFAPHEVAVLTLEDFAAADPTIIQKIRRHCRLRRDGSVNISIPKSLPYGIPASLKAASRPAQGSK